MLKHSIFALVSAASLMALPAAAEERPAGAEMVSVRYGDLDPSRTEDAAILLGRLQRAADAACTPTAAGRGNARLNQSVEACKTETLDRVVAALNEPELTRLYQAQRR